MAISRSISALIVLLWVCVPLSAQWQNYPTPGIPRTPDGKPDLSARAPKTPDGKPDLSGVWTVRNGNKYFQDLGADGVEIPMLPSAKALYEERKGNLQKGHPSERCLGHGVVDFDSHQTPRRMIQTPTWRRRGRACRECRPGRRQSSWDWRPSLEQVIRSG